MRKTFSLSPRGHSLGIVVVTLALSGCVFQVGPESLGERSARPNPGADGPAVSKDDPAVPGDEEIAAPGEEEEPAPPPAPLPPWDFSTRFEGIRDGRIVGNIGPATGLDLATDIAQVYDDGFFTQIAVFAVRNDGRRVMLQLQVDNFGEPFFVPGVGKRLRPGYVPGGGFIGALACEGQDSGDADEPFEDTPFDEEPCDVGIDTEQNPEDPATLRVTLQATFADDNGDCPDDGGADDTDLPDTDGDGDGDLPDCGGNDDGDPDVTDPNDPSDGDDSDPVGPPEEPIDGGGSDSTNPLSATTSFTLTP